MNLIQEKDIQLLVHFNQIRLFTSILKDFYAPLQFVDLNHAIILVLSVNLLPSEEVLLYL